MREGKKKFIDHTLPLLFDNIEKLVQSESKLINTTIVSSINLPLIIDLSRRVNSDIHTIILDFFIN